MMAQGHLIIFEFGNLLILDSNRITHQIIVQYCWEKLWC